MSKATERQIPLEGAFNFRDFGGYRTNDGRTVKKGLLYRSDELCFLTENDVKTLQELGLKTIVDYRNERERVNKEDVAIPGVTVHYLDPKADVAAMASAELPELSERKVRELTASHAKTLMVEQNRQFPVAKDSSKAYRALLDLVLDEKNLPLVHHCRGGKDRTGYGAAIILLLLGVDKDSVVQDYLDTNLCKHEKNEKSLQTLLEKTGSEDLVQAMRYLKEANEEFLMTALLELEKQYGTVEQYAKQALGLTDTQLEQLKEQLLERE